jgi:hypothetical protein
MARRVQGASVSVPIKSSALQNEFKKLNKNCTMEFQKSLGFCYKKALGLSFKKPSNCLFLVTKFCQAGKNEKVAYCRNKKCRV